MSKDYWRECISEALEDAGVTASPEQIDTITSWVEGAHDNYGMAHGHDCIPNPLKEEISELKVRLGKEMRKVVCKECNGSGRIFIQGPYHGSDSSCSRCHGEGYVLP